MKTKIKKFLLLFFAKFVKPLSENQDAQRREFILNIFLLSAVFFFGLSFLFATANYIKQPFYHGMPLGGFLLGFLLFLFLHFLSRKGFSKTASYFFVSIFFLFSTAAIIQWGADLPAALLFFVLTITISGILIGTSFAFFVFLLVSISIFVIGNLQFYGIIAPDLYWTQQKMESDALISYIFLFFIITITSWLSNREIEKSLERARKSEAELKVERDSLEIKVRERTQALKKMEMEKMSDLFRFAEIGRLSSGLFHDLVNPLTAISLNIEKAKSFGGEELTQVKKCLADSVSAVGRMNDVISAVRRQIVKKEKNQIFSIEEELRQVIKVFSFRAKKENISVIFSPEKDIKISGDPVKFSQIAANFLANSLDSYDHEATAEKKVLISLKEEDGAAVLKVKDFGCGISRENKNKIFQPFFTTKDFSRGTGIGLSLVKEMVEKDFGGTVGFISEADQGSEFFAYFKKENF